MFDLCIDIYLYVQYRNFSKCQKGKQRKNMNKKVKREKEVAKAVRREDGGDIKIFFLGDESP